VHYAALRQPLDPSEFIASLQDRMTAALDQLDTRLGNGAAGGVRIVTRRGDPWINVPKLQALPGPAMLDALKSEVARRWGTLDLLNVSKESEFLTGYTREFQSVASREVIDRETLRRRLLLCLFALGTNIGIRGIMATGDHGQSEAALRHVRRHYINRDNLCRAIAQVANATFAARDSIWWGEGTAYAWDSTRLDSWESNLMTGWHQRYGGPGVMIYWHVERDSVCIYSPLKTCSSSEVAAMIEGLLCHCTTAEIEANYTDTHGASIIGFALCELLGFRLLPSSSGSARSASTGPTTHPPAGPNAADPVGADRPPVRPTGQVRDRAATRDRRGRAGPAALHPRRAEAPDLPGAGGARPRGADDLRLRVPRPARAAA
jgi:hypothetical protein